MGSVLFMDRYESVVIAWISIGRGDYERSTEMSPKPWKKVSKLTEKGPQALFRSFSEQNACRRTIFDQI